MRVSLKIKHIILLFSFFLASPLFSQSKADTLNYFFESVAVASSGENTPFWLLSNNYGTITLKSPNILARTGLTGTIDLNKTLRIIYGIDIIDRYSNNNDLFIQQAYAGLKLGFITLKAGSREEKFGNQDYSLGSGGIIWSGNARPVPQVSISVPEYVPLPFTKNLVEFKGGISHGWLGDNQYVSNELLHHKFLYLKTHLAGHIQVEYGLHHFAQWGGISTEYGKLPNDLNTFFKVFFSKGGDDNAPLGESINAIGNHVGSHNLGIYYTGEKIALKFYFQNIFEDRSGLELSNFPDGLWGLTVSSENWKHISKILMEVISTNDQSGRVNHYYKDGHYIPRTGNDNYFNHEVYAGGWTYQGKTIGSPLITSPEIMSSSTYPTLLNNKLTAIHLGFEGDAGLFNYKTLYTFSRNYGTNLNPFTHKRDQHSVLLKGTINNLFPCKLSLSAAIAFDIGELYKNNLGLMISLKKEGMITSLLSNR